MPEPDETALRLAVAEREAGVHLEAFQQAPVPLVLVEADGTVRNVNVAVARLCDTSLGAVTGRPAWMLFGAANRSVLEEATRRSLVAHEAGRWPIRVNGERMWLVSAPLGGPDVDGVCLLAVLGAPVFGLPPGVPDPNDSDEGRAP